MPTAIWIESDVRPAAVGANAPVSPAASIERAWKERRVELMEIRRYEDDWDGYGAAAPSPRTVDLAIEFIRVLRARDHADPPVRVALSPNGAIIIEWQRNGAYREAKLDGSSTVQWMHAPQSGRPEFTTEYWPQEQGDDWQLNDKNGGGAAVSASAR